KIEVPGKVLWTGPTSRIPREYRGAKALDLGKKRAVVPGWVDCHTHLVFAGDRSEEFALRCAGLSYEEIARRGGGILTTVKATRSAPEGALFKLAEQRVHEALELGVRVIEIKTGYGLEAEAELKCLRVVRKLRDRFPEMVFQSTFLGAHAFPKGVARDRYLRDLLEVMLPQVAKRGLADACDVFVDEGYFTVADARAILGRARTLGLKTKIHADELGNTESAALAAELGCLSADHLLRVSDRGISALAESGTVAVLLPGTALYLKAPYAPARRLIDAGARVAVSTDFNPGSSMMNHLPAALTLSALYMGMSKAELLCSVTYNAARALGLHGDAGTLEPGFRALHWVMPFERFEECYYRFAWTSR
ncbi:MAG: imidazolonepropionase, partial [Bdellovibrionales bacterium]|nr:imidazolonepropionase [Bdellovibrionales bacterium]